MNKLIVIALVVLFAACVDAKSKVAERMTQKTEAAAAQVQATQLVSGSGTDCGCQGQQDASAQSGSGCGCGTTPTYVGGVGGGSDSGSSWKDVQQQQLANLGPRPRVEDAIRPIDEWIQDFSKRSDLQGSLWEAAKSTVQPLIRKLYRSQQEAIDRLKVSNRSIRDHVEEAATEHVYNLLKSKRSIEDAELGARAKKAQLAEAKDALATARSSKDAAERGAKEMAEAVKREKAMEAEARQKAGLPPSKDNTTNAILDNINKIMGSK